MVRHKQKILYVITKGNWGGAQRYVFDLATSMPQDRFEVEVALGGNGPLKEKLEAANIKTLILQSLERDVSIVKEIRAFLNILKTIKDIKPDIVHLNSSKAGALGALAVRLYNASVFFLKLFHVPCSMFHVQIIFTVHGWPFNENRSWLWQILTWLASYITALLSTDIIVIASREFEQAKAMPFIIAKTHLIPNGIRTLEYFSREEARKKLGLSQEIFVIGSIFELTWNKNHAGLIMVANRLWERYDFKLVVIGDGEDRAEITEKIKNDPVLNGRTMFCGFKEDAYKYLKAYDVFVLPSLKEGLPYVLLEAGAAMLPVVATSVGGIPDIIEDKKTGLLVPPKDLKSLADALRRLLEEKETRERLGRELRERVRQTFSFKQMLAKTLKLYERATR